MAGKQLTLTLSFKVEEKWIYDAICTHSSKGGYVKDCVARDIRGEVIYQYSDNHSVHMKRIEDNKVDSLLNGLI